MADLFGKEWLLEMSYQEIGNLMNLLRNLLVEMKSKQGNPERNLLTSLQPIPYGCSAITNQG